ncbi:MAG TPA: hypothetical protein VML55_12105 [Planctomycetaceae bacterium]|nr:hypothetical protein [Planctomycetaceae bacterium]
MRLETGLFRRRAGWLAALSLTSLAVLAVTGSCITANALRADQPVAAATGDTKKLVGELTGLTSRRLAIDTGAETVALRVSDETRVTIDGRRAKLADLQMRQFAEVTAREDGRQLAASVIAARSIMSR